MPALVNSWIETVPRVNLRISYSCFVYTRAELNSHTETLQPPKPTIFTSCPSTGNVCPLVDGRSSQGIFGGLL